MAESPVEQVDAVEEPSDPPTLAQDLEVSSMVGLVALDVPEVDFVGQISWS